MSWLYCTALELFRAEVEHAIVSWHRVQSRQFWCRKWPAGVPRDSVALARPSRHTLVSRLYTDHDTDWAMFMVCNNTTGTWTTQIRKYTFFRRTCSLSVSILILMSWCYLKQLRVFRGISTSHRYRLHARWGRRTGCWDVCSTREHIRSWCELWNIS